MSFEMILSREKRVDMLRRDWDVQDKDLIKAVRQNLRLRNQRKTTVNNLNAAKLEWMWECATRKAKRVVLHQKTVDQQVQDMMSQVGDEATTVPTKNW